MMSSLLSDPPRISVHGDVNVFERTCEPTIGVSACMVPLENCTIAYKNLLDIFKYEGWLFKRSANGPISHDEREQLEDLMSSLKERDVQGSKEKIARIASGTLSCQMWGVMRHLHPDFPLIFPDSRGHLSIEMCNVLYGADLSDQQKERLNALNYIGSNEKFLQAIYRILYDSQNSLHDMHPRVTLVLGFIYGKNVIDQAKQYTLDKLAPTELEDHELIKMAQKASLVSLCEDRHRLDSQARYEEEEFQYALQASIELNSNKTETHSAACRKRSDRGNDDDEAGSPRVDEAGASRAPLQYSPSLFKYIPLIGHVSLGVAIIYTGRNQCNTHLPMIFTQIWNSLRRSL